MNYLNTDRQYILFQKTLNSEIYVDKSLLIEKISAKIRTNSKYICITRPRRFGKTINANMLGAYYTKGFDGHILFDNLKIAGSEIYPKHMNTHNVINIDFSRMPDICTGYQQYITDILEGLREDLEETYPNLAGKTYSKISEMLRDKGDSFIFILD